MLPGGPREASSRWVQGQAGTWEEDPWEEAGIFSLHKEVTHRPHLLAALPNRSRSQGCAPKEGLGCLLRQGPPASPPVSPLTHTGL